MGHGIMQYYSPQCLTGTIVASWGVLRMAVVVPVGSTGGGVCWKYIVIASTSEPGVVPEQFLLQRGCCKRQATSMLVYLHLSCELSCLTEPHNATQHHVQREQRCPLNAKATQNGYGVHSFLGVSCLLGIHTRSCCAQRQQ